MSELQRVRLLRIRSVGPFGFLIYWVIRLRHRLLLLLRVRLRVLRIVRAIRLARLGVNEQYSTGEWIVALFLASGAGLKGDT